MSRDILLFLWKTCVLFRLYSTFQAVQNLKDLDVLILRVYSIFIEQHISNNVLVPINLVTAHKYS